MSLAQITFDEVYQELASRPDGTPRPEAIELTWDELMTLRLHKESITAGLITLPIGSEPEKLLGLPIRLVKEARNQRITPNI